MEHPFQQLPCSIVRKFSRGQTIYSEGDSSTHFYLLMDGKVKLFRASGTATRSTLLDIYGVNEFFGESAFIHLLYSETAEALENTRVMTWSMEEIDRLVPDRPRLAISLIQFIIQRTDDRERRIESFAVDGISARLARALLRFSERFGRQAGDDRVHMVPFTHELLAQYVGTSRETISEYMNQFRQDGLVDYSRRELILSPDALKKWLS